MKIDISLPIREVMKQVLNNRATKLYERDTSVIGKWAKDIGTTRRKPIRKAEITTLSK